MAELCNIDIILCLVNVRKSKFYLGGSDVSVAGAPWFPPGQKIRPRERVYPYDIIVHNGGLEQY